MNKQFVTYEISLKLKELGFVEECIGWYNTIPNELPNDPDHKEELNFAFPWDIQKSIDEGYQHILKAPIWSQTIDWLRNEHSLHITFLMGHDEESVWYDWHISKIEKSYDYTPIASSDNGYDYNKTRERAILKAIELIKEVK